MSRRRNRDHDLAALGERVSAARAAAEARGESFYPGASRVHLSAFPPAERWDDWVELSSRAWPARHEKHYMLVPTTCFNCESACGLLAYVDRDTRQVRKFEGNPEHPGSRGRNCAKGPATLNQVTDPDRVLYPMKRAGRRGEGRWARISWDEALDALAARIRAALTEGRPNEIMVYLGRPGEDGFTERVLASWGVDGHNSHTNVCSSGGRTGFQFWMGIDRPSPDHAHATVIYLISAHWRPGTTSTRTPSGSPRPGRTAPRSSCWIPGCPTPPRTPTTGCRRSPQRGRRQPGHRQPSDPNGPV